MKVLILGANGMLGPHVVKVLEGRHELRLTDINDLDSPHEYFKVDAGDIDQVVSAAEGMDAIINLSVLRTDRQLAFDVSARGCYNMMAAAVEHGIDRVINSGPFYRGHRSHLRTVRPPDRTGRSTPAGDVPVRVNQVAGTGDLPRLYPSSTTFTSWTCCSTCSSIRKPTTLSRVRR